MKFEVKFLLTVLLMFFAIQVYAEGCGVYFEPYEPKKHEIIFAQETYPISSINPTIQNNPNGSSYPGLRCANQLIIYTPKYGKSTLTNEFGAEAVVNEKTVTSLSGADSLIPKNGCVISAHGKAKKWMNENIFLGSKIYVDVQNKLLTTYVTSDSFIFGANEKISEANEMINYYENTFISYKPELAKSYVKDAEKHLKRAISKPKNVQKYATLAINSANSALAYAIPYKSNELKGVWIRPTKSTVSGIIETVENIHRAGIEDIFLETYFHGKTIFPSRTMKEYGFTEQNEIFKGIDALQVWIQEAHKRNMKVHIWFESFYIGNRPASENPNGILATRPEWINTNKRSCLNNTPTPSLSEHNGYFLDPANPEVQEFLISLLREIIIDYKPDGINLDYIRYPQSTASNLSNYIDSNWGYTKYATNEFKSLYGINPIQITSKGNMWDIWSKYRQDKVTQFVRKASNLCRSHDVKVTAVIFPSQKGALNTKQQDWKSWSEKGYLDAITPLFLTCDAKTIQSMINEVTRELSINTDLYAGLFVTFMGGSEEDLLRQIHETRKLNLQGVIIFDYAHLEDRYVDTLSASVFNDKTNFYYNAEKVLPKSVRCQSKRIKRWGN